MFPRSDPRRLKLTVDLALMRRQRYRLSNQREELDKAIVLFTESILLPPLSWLQYGSMILKVLMSLSGSLLMRSAVSKQPDDAICATKYFLHLRDQPQDIPGIPRHAVTGMLVEALGLQVNLEVGNVMQNIREMAILSREVLNLDPPDDEATHLITLIYTVVEPNIRAGVPNQPLDELIECLRAARKRRPDQLRGEGLLAYAISLGCRYSITNVDDDYDEAASIMDDILTSRYPGNSQDERAAVIRANATSFVTALAKIRSSRTPLLDDQFLNCFIMAGVPSKLIMLRLLALSGSSRTLCLKTHCLQDPSTKSIPPSHNCSTISPSFLDLILVALNLWFLWQWSEYPDTFCQIKGKNSTRQSSYSQNRYSYHPFHGYSMVQSSLKFSWRSPLLFFRARLCPNSPRMPFAQPNTSFIFEINPKKSPVPRHSVTRLHVEVLCLQVEFEVGNVMQNIREIAILSRELLTLDLPDDEATHLITLISRVVATNVNSLLTHVLQDLSTKSISPSHNCSTFSPLSLDLILVAFNL